MKVTEQEYKVRSVLEEQNHSSDEEVRDYMGAVGPINVDESASVIEL